MGPFTARCADILRVSAGKDKKGERAYIFTDGEDTPRGVAIEYGARKGMQSEFHIFLCEVEGIQVMLETNVPVYLTCVPSSRSKVLVL